MRIKSYFAPSVQAAIAIARKEFGDCVTLVTSHVASLDNRHLGEYEVVFAIEEKVDQPEEQAEPPAPAFQDLLQQAITAPPPMQENVPDRLEQINSILVELGIEASLVRSFMAMLKVIVSGVSNVPSIPSVPDSPAVSVSADILPIAPPEEPVVLSAIPASEEQPALKLFVAPQPEIAKPAPVPFDLSLFSAPRPPQPRFSAAELAFMSLVSSPKEQGA
jgi:hypothetical protein